MADSVTSTSSSSRSRLGLRYSLRTLLILVTLASLGLWYWFRVPYATEVQVSFPRPELLPQSDPFQSGVDPFAIPTIPSSKQVQRFRRVLWGSPIRHGHTEIFYPSGEPFGEDQWRDGALHGPSVRWFASGEIRERGEYIRGKRQGLWQGFDKQGRPWFEVNFDQDVPHGDARWRLDAGQPVLTVRSNHGEVVEIDGRQVDDLLGRAYRKAKMGDSNVVELFCTPATWDFFDTPLKDVADQVAETCRINVMLDRSSPWTDGTPVTFAGYHMTANTFLAALFDQMARESNRDMSRYGGPAATYRHGCVWITTKEYAQSWVDRTGVNDLFKSPPGASQRQRDELKRNLDRPLTMSFVDMSAADVANHLRTGEKLPIAWAGPTDGPKVSTGCRNLPLRHVLGAICEQHDLRVRWGEGASLVLEPQDRDTP